jgi:hypothetical protein
MHSLHNVVVAVILSVMLISGTPTPTPTPAGTPTVTPAPNAKAKSAGNLRMGPGMTYPIKGGVKAGQALAIVARNEAGDWLQVAGGLWIAAQLITKAPSVPVALAIPPLPTQAPQRVVPAVAVAPTAPPAPAAPAANQGYTCDKCIKGNISSKNEKIYHYPGCLSYKVTKIDEGKGERWFSSEAEAVAAGWRGALNCH